VRSGGATPAPVDPTIRALDCRALVARITQADAAIKSRFVQLEAEEKVVDARIKATAAAAGAHMAITSQMYSYGGPAARLAAAAMALAADPGMAAMAAGNASAVSGLDRLRGGVDPLLRDRTTRVFYAQHKECLCMPKLES
jgi:hypothetical protein